MEKTFEFENGFISFSLESEGMRINVQAKHSNSMKYTSAAILVDKETSKDMFKWLKEAENVMG